MKFTDQFFTIPVRLYDIQSIVETAMEEDKIQKDTGAVKSLPVNYATSNKKLLIKDIKTWNEGYGNEYSLEDVIENGFPITVVDTYQGDSYECNWTLFKFEEELNKFYEQSQKPELQ